MIIKLKRKAQWGGEARKANSVHDVDSTVAEKLLVRGLAVPHDQPEAEVERVEEELEDGPAASQ